MEITLPESLLRRASDAVREVVQFYQQHFAEREMAGEAPSEAQQKWMRDLRGLRDDLAVAGRQQPPTLRWNKAAAQRMVSCAVFAMESVADRMPARGMQRDAWDQGAQALHELFEMASEFVFDPVQVLERPRRRTPFPMAVKDLVERLNGQVRSGRGRRAAPAPVRPTPSGGILREDMLHEQWAGSAGTQGRNLIPDGEGTPRRTPGLETGACIDFERVEKPPAQPASRTRGGEGDLKVNLRAVQEPKLRLLVEQNCEGLRQALAAGDDRLAAVMLCAAMESVVLDVAMRRRQEFQLRGHPDAWNLALLVRTLAGEHGVDGDRSALIYTLDCSRLLRPAVQLTSPTTIDRDTVLRMVGSVQRFVNALGFAPSLSGV